MDDENQMELPPGFRFHPTDEELITHYLSKKALDSDFSAIAISEVDMNKLEPWELPWKAKVGEKEWYFFCMRDKKYPTGIRTNRATPSGYWKATGKDKEILRGKALVGMKKTLVFYRGRAPKGEKSNWVSHEYRLEGKLSPHTLPKPSRANDWVISRVFHKTSGGKKVHISGLMKMDPGGNELHLPSGPLPPLPLPPLMDPSPPPDTGGNPESGGHHVHCFSNAIPDKIQGDNNNPISNLPLDSFLTAPGIPWGQIPPDFHPGTGFQDASIVGAFLATTAAMTTEHYSFVAPNVEVGKEPMDEAGIVHQDFDCIWSC